MIPVVPTPTKRLIETAAEAERLAHDINTKRRAMIDFDEKRQKNVEALRCIRNGQVGEKAWVCCGPFFLKMPTTTLKVALMFGVTTTLLNSLRLSVSRA